MHVLFLYGSQTGAAKGIAETLHATAGEKGIEASIGQLNAYKKIGFLEAWCVVVVCSTTGNGDPPDNAEAFWRFLRRRSHPADLLSGQHLAILALGDTNYDRFCQAGKVIHAKAKGLGAEELVPLGLADEAMGLESVVDPWSTRLFSSIESLMARPEAKALWLQPRPHPEPAAPGHHHRRRDHATPAAATDAVATTAASQKPPSPKAELSGGMALLSRMRAQPAAQKPAQPQRANPGASAASGGGKAATPVTDAVPAEHDWLQQGTRRMARPTRGVLRFAEAFKRLGVQEVPELSEKEVVPKSRSILEVSQMEVGKDESPATCLPSLDHPNAGLSAARAVEVPIVGARYLTAGGRQADRRVLHMELGLAGSPLAGAWSPGDAIGILAPNSDRSVDKLMGHLGLRSDARVTMKARPQQPRKLPKFLRGKAKAKAKPAAAKAPVLPSHLRRLGAGCSLRRILREAVDLASPPRPPLLRAIADSCTSAKDRSALRLLASKTELGRRLFAAIVESQRLTVLDVLALAPSAKPTVEALLSVLPPLAPRLYSFSSSALADPERASVAFKVVTNQCGIPDPEDRSTMLRPGPVTRPGLATTWLETLCQPLLADSVDGCCNRSPSLCPKVRVFLRPSTSFFPPGSLRRPMVMVGPGTGVAPFRAFLQHREARQRETVAESAAVCAGSWRGMDIDFLEEPAAAGGSGASPPPPVALGETLLFFGNQHRERDFLYEADWRRWEAEGTLSRLVTAFSRQDAPPAGQARLYVQHRMTQPAQAQQLASLILEKEAFVFVCGDGSRMAGDVDAALQQALAAHPSVGSVEEAGRVLKEMALAQRYVRDLWSA